MRIVTIALAFVRQWGETLGPYLLLELLLPGGSLWALLYFLYRRRRQATAASNDGQYAEARNGVRRISLPSIAWRAER